jgi:hypothetical protein
VSAFRIDFQNNHPATAIFVSWAVLSSLLLFALFPNWLTLAFILLVWLPLSFYQKRKLMNTFIVSGAIHLDGKHMTLKGDSGLDLQGEIDSSSFLFDSFVAIKLITTRKSQWVLFLTSSVDSVSWSRLRRAIADAKED